MDDALPRDKNKKQERPVAETVAPTAIPTATPTNGGMYEASYQRHSGDSYGSWLGSLQSGAGTILDGNTPVSHEIKSSNLRRQK